MRIKKCKKCSFLSCKKNWKRNGVQRYKCGNCWYIRENRRHTKDHTKLYQEYSTGKQTYAQLAVRYKKHITTIKRYIESYELAKKK